MSGEMRTRLAGLLAVAVLAAAASTTAADARASCTGTDAAGVVAMNADRGFRNYLVNLGKPYWRRSISPLPKGPYCGSLVTTAKQSYAAQKRFYVLLMAFPINPTRAQWNARFKPLVDAAIACDGLIMQVIGRQDLQTHDLAWLRSIRNSPYGTNL